MKCEIDFFDCFCNTVKHIRVMNFYHEIVYFTGSSWGIYAKCVYISNEKTGCCVVLYV